MFKCLIRCLFLLLLLVSCGRYAGVRQIIVNPASAELAIGETLWLDYTVDPFGSDHVDFPDWEVSDPSIVEFSGHTGYAVITGISEGTCTISVKFGYKSGACEITVYKPKIPVSLVVLSEDKFDLKKTDTKRLEAYVFPMNADETTVNWTSSDPAKATVDGTGLVTAIGAGSTLVTAECSGVSASCAVSVWERSGITVKCVDLGLSVDWCTTDLGAARPEELGDYYAWGEVKSKIFFDWSNYAHYDETYRDLTKYNSDQNLGPRDGRVQLELTDDAAYRIIDDDYRIPSSAQWVEMLENCNWEETKLNDVRGYRVSSISDPERWIFLPYGDSVSGVIPSTIPDYRGMYWSSSRVTNAGFSSFAWTVMISHSKIDRVESERCDGMRIRPVRLKN